MILRFERELYGFLESKHADLLKDIREKKELIPALQERLNSALADFGRLFKA